MEIIGIGYKKLISVDHQFLLTCLFINGTGLKACLWSLVCSRGGLGWWVRLCVVSSVCVHRHRIQAGRVHHPPEAHDLRAARGETRLLQYSCVCSFVLTVDVTGVLSPQCTTAAMECLRQYLSELLDFIADMHTLTKLKVLVTLISCVFSFMETSHICLICGAIKPWGNVTIKCPSYWLWKVHILVLGIPNNRLHARSKTLIICIYFYLICSTTPKRFIVPSPSPAWC